MRGCSLCFRACGVFLSRRWGGVGEFAVFDLIV